MEANVASCERGKLYQAALDARTVAENIRRALRRIQGKMESVPPSLADAIKSQSPAAKSLEEVLLDTKACLEETEKIAGSIEALL